LFLVAKKVTTGVYAVGYFLRLLPSMPWLVHTHFSSESVGHVWKSRTGVKIQHEFVQGGCYSRQGLARMVVAFHCVGSLLDFWDQKPRLRSLGETFLNRNPTIECLLEWLLKGSYGTQEITSGGLNHLG